MYKTSERFVLEETNGSSVEINGWSKREVDEFVSKYPSPFNDDKKSTKVEEKKDVAPKLDLDTFDVKISRNSKECKELKKYILKIEEMSQTNGRLRALNRSLKTNYIEVKTLTSNGIKLIKYNCENLFKCNDETKPEWGVIRSIISSCEDILSKTLK